MEKCKGMWHFDGSFYLCISEKQEWKWKWNNLVWAFIIQTIEIEGNNNKMGEIKCISHMKENSFKMC